MGEERSWKGKHFLLCLACCVSILLGFCACVHPVRQWQAEQNLKEAKDLRSAGNYPASEKKALAVLQAFPQTLGDEALYQMGLLYSLPKNPNADYEKSKGLFEKLVTRYPDSSRKEEAAVWSLVLDRIVDNEKKILELQKKVRLLEEASESRVKRLRQLQEELGGKDKEATEHRGKKLRQLQEELEDRKREITEYLEMVSQLQSRVIELESQLAKFKDIDLTIEQKKRSTTP